MAMGEGNGNGCCAKKGPGYASPIEAMSGPRETLIYVTCVYNGIFSFSSFYSRDRVLPQVESESKQFILRFA